MKGETYQRGVWQLQANKEVEFVFPVCFIWEGQGIQNVINLLTEIWAFLPYSFYVLHNFESHNAVFS